MTWSRARTPTSSAAARSRSVRSTSSALVEGALLLQVVLGIKILVSETRYTPGTTFVVPRYGDLNIIGQHATVCRYFTGRGFKTDVEFGSPTNMIGDGSCPFLDR